MNEYAYSNGIDYDPDLIQDRRRGDDGRGFAMNDEPECRRERYDAESSNARRGGSAGSPRGKRKPKNKENKPFGEYAFVKFLRDSRLHVVVGVFLCFVAIYITIAGISFLKHGAQDESLVSSMTPTEIVESGVEVENAAGPIGAHLAQSMIVSGIGLGSIALVVYLVLISLSLMEIRKCKFWSVTFKSLLVAVALSMVSGFVSLWLGLDANIGGYHGRYMNLMIVSYLNWIGALLVNLMLIVAVFYVYINDILALYSRYMAVRRARRAQAEQKQMQEDEARERVRRAMDEVDRQNDESESHVESRLAYADAAVNVSIGFDDVQDEVEDVYAVREESHKNVSHQKESPAVSAEDAYQAPIESVIDKVPTEVASSEQPAQSVAVMPELDVVSNVIEEGSAHAESVYDPTAELSRYKMPGLELLKETAVKANNVDLEEQEENKERITKTLNDYGIAISHIQATVGPTVTLYEIIPAEGVRIAKIKRLEDDIAMSLSALGIRIIAPIPGKGTIGIEVPNKEPQTVSIRAILGSKKYQECKYALPMAMGATISNEVYIADLCKMPHLLVAGATGMGKSVGLNTIIASLLYKKHPAELKFVLIDPKMVEFSLYSVLERHYLAKLPDEEDAVVTSMDKVLVTLNSLCVEMDQRYMLLRDANVRSITEYNERFIEKKLNPEKGHRYLPYIVMIVDEFADLIMTAGKDVEKPIARIAQKARAVGMHMIIATQRPSTNVITGIIKANFPGRIAFRVSQMVDSKTILDRTGANQLIGRGDMLFSHNGSLDRVQCAFIDTPEVQAICNHIDSQVGYEHAYYLPEPIIENESAGMGNVTDRDPLFEEAAEAIVVSGVASTSSLQRRYSIGYNRAGKIMDQLEAAGIVGPAQGGKPRTVLVDSMQLGVIMRSFE